MGVWRSYWPQPVYYHGRFVPDHPGFMAARERGDVARARDDLAFVVHPNRKASTHVVLKVGASQLEVLARGFTSFDPRHPG